MNIKIEIELNKFGQSLLNEEFFLNLFLSLDIREKRDFLKHLIELILQSKPEEEDIQKAISESKLKETYTPCILLTKGVKRHQLEKIINLPENEINKTLILFLYLFRTAYKRRFEKEKNSLHKWWYWDLSDKKNIDKILNKEYES